MRKAQSISLAKNATKAVITRNRGDIYTNIVLDFNIKLQENQLLHIPVLRRLRPRIMKLLFLKNKTSIKPHRHKMIRRLVRLKSNIPQRWFIGILKEILVQSTKN
jgi:hypothetical protein